MLPIRRSALSSSASSTPSSTFTLAAALFFVSGFAALNYQICWQRALFGWYGIDLDSVSAIVSIFMLGLGVGALAGGWLADRFANQRVLVFSAIEFLIGVFGLFSLNLIDGAGVLLTSQSLPAVIGVTFLVFLVPTAAMGATLPILVTELTSRTGNVGASTGSLYYINTLGAATGALTSAFFLLPLLGLDGTVLVAAASNLVVAGAAAFAFRKHATPPLPITAEAAR